MRENALPPELANDWCQKWNRWCFNCNRAGGNSVSNDLETLRQFLASPLFIALLDLIWLPLFVIALATLHPALGWFCLAGGAFFFNPGDMEPFGSKQPSPR